MEIETTGVSIVTIKGDNFGLNPSVSLQNVDIFGGRIYAQMEKDQVTNEDRYYCGKNKYLVPEYDMASGLCITEQSVSIVLWLKFLECPDIKVLI